MKKVDVRGPGPHNPKPDALNVGADATKDMRDAWGWSSNIVGIRSEHARLAVPKCMTYTDSRHATWARTKDTAAETVKQNGRS